MNSVNVRWEDEMVRFDCPHCGVDGEVDAPMLRAIWATDGTGVVTCPPPDGCSKEYTLVTLEEMELHKASAPIIHAQHELAPVELPATSPEISLPKPEAERVVEPIVKAVTAVKRHVNPTTHPVPARMKLALRTFRHIDYKQSGQDLFDQSVSDFLEQLGTENIVSINPINYMDRDDKLVDYGVMVVHRKPIDSAPAPTEKQEWRD